MDAPLIADLFDLEFVDQMIADGYVRKQVHPALPLAILNYTEKAQFERVWNMVTTTCRGLIYDTSTGEIVARPFPKFWNHSEAESAAFDLDEPAVVFDKADGSLAIIHAVPDGYAVATRGSFTSDQAIHATDVLRSRYGHWSPPDGTTVLAEIVFPSNRIVVDYGDLDDLVLLGAVDIKTGRTFGPDTVPDWPGPVIETFPYRTLREALAAPVRDNREGFVIWFPGTDARTKLKYEAYVHLHRIVTGLNARTVWEMLGAGKTIAEICEPLPDELHAWVEKVAAELQDQAYELLYDTEQFHEKTVAKLPDGWGRKEYALAVAHSTLRPWLFNLYDGKDPRPAIWKAVRPSGDRRPVNVSEDAA